LNRRHQVTIFIYIITLIPALIVNDLGTFRCLLLVVGLLAFVVNDYYVEIECISDT
jgi:hypothetical protein